MTTATLFLSIISSVHFTQVLLYSNMCSISYKNAKTNRPIEEPFCGKFLRDRSSESRISCSVSCLSKLWCDSILFNPYEHSNGRCILIKTSS